MNSLMRFEDICLEEVNGDLFTDSLQVAEHFNKEHKNVLRAVDDLSSKLSNDFYGLNFERREKTFKTPGGLKVKETRYLMTRDGFSMLVMGFTGKKATAWKEKYIKAFNEMEKALLHTKGAEWALKRLEGKHVRRELTDVIRKFVSYAIEQGSESYAKRPELAYINITKMEYSALFLLKKAIPDLRDKLDLMDHNSLVAAERGVGRCLKECMDKGMHYKDIYQECKRRVLQHADFVGVSSFTSKYIEQHVEEIEE